LEIVYLGLLKLDLDIGVNDTDRTAIVAWADFDDVELVEAAHVLDLDGVALV